MNPRTRSPILCFEGLYVLVECALEVSGGELCLAVSALMSSARGQVCVFEGGREVAFQRTYSGAPWEQIVGYCRAVRAGDHVHVTGTAPVAEGGGVHAPGDAYEQARRCLELAMSALEELGATTHHVVRTRMFVTDISRWEAFGKAHAECFQGHHPATTMVEVSALIDPEMLIEIEVDAYVGD